MKKDIIFLLFLGGISLIISLFDLVPLPFDAAWIAIIFCGIPIIMEAVTGLVTAFDIKADVLYRCFDRFWSVLGKILRQGKLLLSCSWEHCWKI